MYPCINNIHIYFFLFLYTLLREKGEIFPKNMVSMKDIFIGNVISNTHA